MDVLAKLPQTTISASAVDHTRDFKFFVDAGVLSQDDKIQCRGPCELYQTSVELIFKSALQFKGLNSFSLS